jgi:hypothetical protein
MRITVFEIPSTDGKTINRAVSLRQAMETPQPPGVKFWLSRMHAYQYAEVSPAQLSIMEYRARIETLRVLLSPESQQVRLFVSRDSLDAYRKQYGKGKGKGKVDE